MFSYFKYLPHVAGLFFTAAVATAVTTTQPNLVKRLAYDGTSTAGMPVTCGNSICEYQQGESPDNCPSDCPRTAATTEQKPAPVCGNNMCEMGEEPSNCPSDCKVMTTQPMEGSGAMPQPMPGSTGMMPPPPMGSFGGGQPMMGPQGQFGQPGQMMGPGGFGPSEEEMRKMEEERERREAEMRKRGLDDMKRGIRQFAAQLKRMKSRIALMERQGIKLPTETKELLNKTDSLLKTILEAKDFDEAQEAIEEMQAVGEQMGDIMQTIEMAARFPRMFSQAQREVRRVEAGVKQIKTRVTRSKINVSEQVAKLEQGVANLKAALEKAKGLKDSGQIEEAVETLENDIFEQLEQISRASGSIYAVLSILKFFTQINNDLRRYNSLIARMKRAKKDVSQAEALLAQVKERVAALKELAQSGSTDPEDLFGALEELGDLREQIDDALGVGEEFAPQGGPIPGGALPKLELPPSLFGGEELPKAEVERR